MKRALRRGGTLVAFLVLVLVLPGCGAKKKKEAALVSAPARETYDRGMRLLAQRKLRKATEMLKRIEFSEDIDRELIPLSRVGIADATFYKLGDLSLIEARSLYLDFVTLYGNHPLAPYAQLQAGMCSLEQVRHPSRDQTQTHQAIDDLEIVVARWPGTPWQFAAQTMIGQAQASLAEAEFRIGKFYLDREAYQAAADRFRAALDLHPEYEGRDKVYFFLGKALIASDNTAEGRIYLDKLVHDFPEGPWSDVARKKLASVGGEIDHGVDGAVR
jgi:outer membrane protein assembly factor BamD